jgi:hypothetical protein
MSSKPTAIVPDASARMDCRVLEPPHFAVIDPHDLLAQCDLRTQRRSGPGGQHRNKTSSGAFLTHRPTGLVGEATERRSQSQNRDVALQRLRFLLAIEIRTASSIGNVDRKTDALETEMRSRYQRHSLRFRETNPDKPAVLALVLNDLWAAGGQPSLVAKQWSVSTSKLVVLVRSHPPSLAWVNRVRAHHDRLPLH